MDLSARPTPYPDGKPHPALAGHRNTVEGTVTMETDEKMPEVVIVEAEELIGRLESENRSRMIDYALETDNLQMFNELTEGLQ